MMKTVRVSALFMKHPLCDQNMVNNEYIYYVVKKCFNATYELLYIWSSKTEIMQRDL